LSDLKVENRKMSETAEVNSDITGVKKVKILHLYHDLMNLYGDWANTAALAHDINMRGFKAVFDKKSVGDEIDFEDCGFIYIGSGTERSQLACMRDLMRYKDALIKQIDAGLPVLATGNSHELFGQAVTDSGANRHEMLGLLDFKTFQLNTRVTGDCTCKASFLEDKLVGFINRAGGNQKGEIERPFFIEPGEGANYKAGEEGIRYKNLLGTYMTGPILVRNPPLMKYFADIIAKREGSAASGNNPAAPAGNTEAAKDPFFDYQEKAYKTALDKLKE